MASATEYHIVHGFRTILLNTRPDIETRFVLRRLGAALALIDQYQPWRVRHLRRDVLAIRVLSYPSRGVYFPGDRVILTELSFLARASEFSDAQVASSILHEGVHARIHRMSARLGIGSTHDRAREERLCRRAELAFGESLPPAMGAPVIARAIESLGLPDAGVAPVVDWAAAAAAKQRADRAAVAGARQLARRPT